MASETPLSDVRFLTVAEVALIMRVSKMTVYRLVHSGELEAIRVGRSFRVSEQTVNHYLLEACVGTGWARIWADRLPGPSRPTTAGAVTFYPGSMPSRPHLGGHGGVA